MMYAGTTLIDLLERQHRDRGQGDLFKKGTFTFQWRIKVGSFPHPDGETMISAAEPCGAWQAEANCPQKFCRPEDKRELKENWQYFRELPLYGYIPASSIRGIVRAWAKKRPAIRARMEELLGKQEGDEIRAGRIEFLDAWPLKATKVSLDVVNPQQHFQVFHEKQGENGEGPRSLYTLGNGKETIPVTVAIRGVPGKATTGEVEAVWGWVQQALALYGVGSRTASGYGALSAIPLQPDPHSATQQFDFQLFSQGNAGPDTKTMELRPSHWRGWLRSWLLRFFLGVMSKPDAIATVGELLGVLEPETRHGCVRLAMKRGSQWGKDSTSSPDFYYWEGGLTLSTHQKTVEESETLLNEIILPIMRFAVMVGGVGRGWRRPLHIYRRQDEREASRGTYLKLTREVNSKTKLFGLPLKLETWSTFYTNWRNAVQRRWEERCKRYKENTSPLEAEIFSPTTCAVYCVPGPEEEPLDRPQLGWQEIDPEDTRGEGMALIYRPLYKRKREVGGNAGNGSASCSWASIKRVRIRHKTSNTDCQEIVCLFLGKNESPLRSRFLRDLAEIPGASYLFGVPEN